jgi:hypothetical protein
MTKARYFASAMGLAVALSGLLMSTSANAATTAAHPAAAAQVVLAQDASAGCGGSTPATIRQNQDVKGNFWYTDNGQTTCIGTVVADVFNPSAALKKITVHVGPYQYSFGPYAMSPGWTSHSLGLHKLFHRTGFLVCLGAQNTPGYACSSPVP